MTFFKLVYNEGDVRVRSWRGQVGSDNLNKVKTEPKPALAMDVVPSRAEDGRERVG